MDSTNRDSAAPSSELPAGPAPEVTVVMPCLDEAESVAGAVESALEALKQARLEGEVVVVDNGSSDGSAELAAAAGARVVAEPRRGYGRALRSGIAAARGRYVVLGDPDGSYDFGDVPRIVAGLAEGADLVMGSRFAGEILPGAMPWSHRYIGNPVLTGILNLLFGARVSDAHCGLRGLTKAAAERMKLVTTGMEFASEIVIRAARLSLEVREVPIRYHPRVGTSKLRTLRDGWRHLRYMLLLSPTPVLTLPGLVLAVAGLAVASALVGGPVTVSGRPIDVHVMVLGGLVCLLGIQLSLLGLMAGGYARHRGHDTAAAPRRLFTLERGLALGGALFSIGFIIDARILARWIAADYGALDAVRPAFLALLLMVAGAQIASSSLFFSMLTIPVEEE